MVGRAANRGAHARNTHPAGRGPSRSKVFVQRVRHTLERFLHVEAVSGLILLCAAAIAVVWANSPAADSYQQLWHSPLHFVVNDVLMTVFFLVVGMEIRRELHAGALSDLRTATLPVAAAGGGVIAPALIYLVLTGASDVRNGWAIPTATDIAFAVGALALLGRAVPSSVRVMLLAVAIVDDVAAILIIAVFYSGGLEYAGLAIAALGILLVLGFQRIGIAAAYAYIAPGFLLWFGLLKAGAHPTLAGVVLGLMTPVRPLRNKTGSAPVETVQAALHPWVAYGIMPLFALANAGVNLVDIDVTGSGEALVLGGVAAGLVIGKPLGIVLASWLAVRLGLSRLPYGVTWSHLWLIGCFGGIGFTMSIFIATLAFEEDRLLGAAKLGVLIASVVAGVLGLLLGWALRTSTRRPTL